MLIEWLRTDAVTPETFYLIGVILSSSFLLSARHAWTRTAYGVLLAANLALDLVKGKGAEHASHYAGYLLLSVMILHAVERFWWHVVEDAPFPDWKRK